MTWLLARLFFVTVLWVIGTAIIWKVTPDGGALGGFPGIIYSMIWSGVSLLVATGFAFAAMSPSFRWPLLGIWLTWLAVTIAIPLTIEYAYYQGWFFESLRHANDATFYIWIDWSIACVLAAGGFSIWRWLA